MNETARRTKQRCGKVFRHATAARYRQLRGRIITRCALRFEPLVFLRSFELRHLEWQHVDFEAAVSALRAFNTERNTVL
jgi:hypothetical protein